VQHAVLNLVFMARCRPHRMHEMRTIVIDDPVASASFSLSCVILFLLICQMAPLILVSGFYSKMFGKTDLICDVVLRINMHPTADEEYGALRRHTRPCQFVDFWLEKIPLVPFQKVFIKVATLPVLIEIAIFKP